MLWEWRSLLRVKRRTIHAGDSPCSTLNAIRHLEILASSFKGNQLKSSKNLTEEAVESASIISLVARFCNFSTLPRRLFSQLVQTDSYIISSLSPSSDPLWRSTNPRCVSFMNSSVEGGSRLGAREKRGKERVWSRSRNLKGTRLFLLLLLIHHILSLARGWS